MWLCTGATWSWAGGQRGIEQGHSVGLRSRAVCRCAGVQCETVQGRSGGARGAAWHWAGAKRNTTLGGKVWMHRGAA